MWQGARNPFALLARMRSPSDAYKLALERDGEALLDRLLGNEQRKKMRKKERALALLGTLACRRAETTADVDRILAVFAAQKAGRLRDQGLANPYAVPAVAEFIREAASAGQGAGKSAVELYALYAGERIVATFGAAVDARRLSGMFISFDPRPEVARASPGDLLVKEVILMQCRRGLATFDLGIGEARYKAAFCNIREELVETAFAVSLKGGAYLTASRPARRAKRWIKRTPWAWRAISQTRSWLGHPLRP
jgi:CelD/BcsL family acetyltransferase involved in cellulose biosynthesis